MKLMLGVAAVSGGIGVWVGFNSWQSHAVTTTVHASLAILVGGNLLFSSWLCWRAKPGSGDAMVLPTVVILSAAMLIGILPRLLWPAAGVLHMVTSVASALIATSMAVVEIRKRRKLRRHTS